jgi:hypothetical protein
MLPAGRQQAVEVQGQLAAVTQEDPVAVRLEEPVAMVCRLVFLGQQLPTQAAVAEQHLPLVKPQATVEPEAAVKAAFQLLHQLRVLLIPAVAVAVAVAIPAALLSITAALAVRVLLYFAMQTHLQKQPRPPEALQLQSLADIEYTSLPVLVV